MKNSFGLDQMSNRLVKSLIYTIRLPLMTVSNMSLASATFPKLNEYCESAAIV